MNARATSQFETAASRSWINNDPGISAWRIAEAFGIFLLRDLRQAQSMAWRFHEHILRGELDNRTRDRVTGRIWLAGVAEPLVLDLAGDGAPDVAGCVVAFENPVPVAMTSRPPAAQQRGVVGELTTACRLRVFDVPIETAWEILAAGGQPPSRLANALVIEWFSPGSGVFRFETADFSMTISEPAWRFTAAEIAERERRLAEETTDFHEALRADDASGEWDEFRNEQLLRHSDTMNERARRLFEKYAEHPGREAIIAHEMGWESLEEAVAAEKREAARRAAPPVELDEDGEASGHEHSYPDDFDEEVEPDPSREGIDWVHDDEERVVHPIYKRGRDLCTEAMDELREVVGVFQEGEDAEAGEFVGQMMTLGAKLAGALNGLARDAGVRDTPFTVATLKRVLDYHNAALKALGPLEDKPFLSAERLAHYRGELFAIREDLLALIARLRGEG